MLTSHGAHGFGLEIVCKIVLLLAFFPVQPKSIVNLLIIVKKLTLTTSLVFDEISLVGISIFPVVFAITMFSIEHVVPLKMFGTFWIVPHAVTVSVPLLEISLVV
jgi:hypothetical protein